MDFSSLGMGGGGGGGGGSKGLSSSASSSATSGLNFGSDSNGGLNPTLAIIIGVVALMGFLALVLLARK